MKRLINGNPPLKKPVPIGLVASKIYCFYCWIYLDGVLDNGSCPKCRMQFVSKVEDSSLPNSGNTCPAFASLCTVRPQPPQRPPPVSSNNQMNSTSTQYLTKPNPPTSLACTSNTNCKKKSQSFKSFEAFTKGNTGSLPPYYSSFAQLQCSRNALVDILSTHMGQPLNNHQQQNLHNQPQQNHPHQRQILPGPMKEQDIHRIPVILTKWDVMEKQPMCSVCLNDFRHGELVLQLTCSHVLHIHCGSKSLKVRACCPYCNRNISPS